MNLVYVINEDQTIVDSEIIPRVGEYVELEGIDYKVFRVRYKTNFSVLGDNEIEYDMSQKVYIYLD